MYLCPTIVILANAGMTNQEAVEPLWKSFLLSLLHTQQYQSLV